jgi:hypothetical protein
MPLQAGHRINLRLDDACFGEILYRFRHSGQVTIINGTPLVAQDLSVSSTGNLIRLSSMCNRSSYNVTVQYHNKTTEIAKSTELKI